MVLYDRDPRFMSSFYAACFELLGSCVVFFCVFHPQLDG